nr:MAG TPA: hypothetical protein [Caudoviricetes sp.]
MRSRTLSYIRCSSILIHKNNMIEEKEVYLSMYFSMASIYKI